MDWRFAAVLILALLLSMAMSVVQMRAYMRQVNEIAKANAGKNLNLVSGRGKGAFRGSIVVLLVDPVELRVVEARALLGVTVFGRLKPAPQLEGSLEGVVDRASTNKQLRKATVQAVGMLPAKIRPRVAPTLTKAGRAPKPVPMAAPLIPTRGAGFSKAR